MVWGYMMRNKATVEAQIRWKIHSETCSFWWDNWLGDGPLAQHDGNITSLNTITVSQFITDGTWNEYMVRRHAPSLLVPKILNTRIFHQENDTDEAVWTPTTSGLFSCSSACELIRKKKEKSRINTHTWNKNIPFKVSFLLWRALRSKLPNNEKIIMFGSDPSRCSCCRLQGWDDINHIFVSGHFPAHIWSFFSAFVGTVHRNIPLKNQFMKWLGLETKNEVHKILLQALPIFICWNLWKNRCAVKYGG